MCKTRVSFLLSAFLGIAQTALAATPIRALIIDGQNNHDWKHTTPVLKKILEDTGMFQVDVVTTPPKGGDFSTFKPEFDKYKLVIGNYNEFPAGDKWPEDVKSAFEQFIRGGGGFVSYHAADNAFPDWKAYNLMIGIGGWMGRNEKAGPYWYFKDDKLTSDPAPGSAGNHGARTPFLVVMRDSKHPIAKGLPAKWMHAPRRAVFEDARTRREYDRAGHCFLRPGQPWHRARRTDVDGADLRERPHFPHDLGARSGGDELRRLHRHLAEGRGVGRDREGHAKGAGRFSDRRQGQHAGSVKTVLSRSRKV